MHGLMNQEQIDHKAVAENRKGHIPEGRAEKRGGQGPRFRGKRRGGTGFCRLLAGIGQKRGRPFDPVRKLPHRYREVIVLRSIAQMPFAEVARILEVTVPAAKMRYRRALDALVEQLREKDPSPDSPNAGENAQ